MATLDLVCPLTKQPLMVMPLDEADRRCGGILAVADRGTTASQPAGRTPSVLVREDGSGAYPVVDGIPVLLGPEVLSPGTGTAVDVSAPQYAEAYQEMDFYNAAPIEDPGWATYVDALGATIRGSERTTSFPHDWRTWLDARYDSLAQWDCYRHLGVVTGLTTMQIGGAGLHATKFLLAGAAHAVVVTPMVQEARRARWLADRARVADRLTAVVAVAEELPFRDGVVDRAFSGGCVHHMVMSLAMPEIRRILRVGGRIAAAEPWRAPLYAWGTQLFGKREANAFCTPLTADKTGVFLSSFESATVEHHGALLRYPLLALSKLGIRPSLAALFWLFRLDDSVSSLLRMRRHGSSIALLGAKC